jgi:hypothetical protein
MRCYCGKNTPKLSKRLLRKALLLVKNKKAPAINKGF